MDEPRHQTVVRYIAPLREGGSLPALAEADDGFKYVVKFRGAGHGTKTLIAEFIGAMVARRMGLPVPEPVFLDVDERFGITEPDEEIQDLLKGSRGLNMGLHYLAGALTLDPYVNPVDGRMASDIVWLDAYLTNVDRTLRNTNMLVWHGTETWLIDHGASLYFHHSWSDPAKAALSPFPYIKDHALLRKADDLEGADHRAHQAITPEFIAQVTAMIPDTWLEWPGAPGTPDELREAYRRFLTDRLENSEIFLRKAIDERRTLI
ncbi:MAG: aminotransferase class I and II [Muribaculaceae bacterium]|nr:aminotransferase class I and II [Muribaculaceae bacterium]